MLPARVGMLSHPDRVRLMAGRAICPPSAAGFPVVNKHGLQIRAKLFGDRLYATPANGRMLDRRL